MNKIVTRVIAVAFCALILFLSVMTLAPNARELGYAVFKRYKNYLPDGANAFDDVSARISSFEESLNNVFYQKETIQQLNASMQYALGKKMLSFGSSTMVTLSTGQLYELQPDMALSETTDDLIELNEYLAGRGIPMLFVYAHTGLYKDNLLPVGALDYNNEAADLILSRMREAGVATLDSREFLSEFPLEDIIYSTDFHWTIRAALECASQAEIWLESVGVAASPINPETFAEETFDGIFLGRLGQRVGARNMSPEAFSVWYPAFDADISVTYKDGDEIETRTGAFKEAVMRVEDAMKKNSQGYSISCYNAYGPHAWESHYINSAAPESRVLVLKDSYGTPAAAFLSLGVGDLLATDQRKSTTTPREYADEYQPDAVIVIYCQDMLRGKNYAFME